MTISSQHAAQAKVKLEFTKAMNLIQQYPVPSMPELLHRLDRELSSGNANTHSITAIIEQDPGVAAQLLHTVNSPAYYSGNTIESIEQAVVRIGIGQIKPLVIEGAVRSSIDDCCSSMRDLYSESYLMGLVASLLSQHVDEVSQEHAFLAGLFHDLGKVVLGQADPSYLQFMHSEEITHFNCADEGCRGSRLTAAERKEFGVTHATLGFLLAKEWNIPEVVRKAILLHHTPDCSTLDISSVRALVAIIKTAHALTNEHLFSAAIGEEGISNYLRQPMQELMLDLETLEDIKEQIASM